MNTLYSLITYGLGSSGEANLYYMKATSDVTHNEASLRLRDMLVQGVPDSKIRLFACAVCHEALLSQFSKEITELDPVNTYTEVSRPDSAALSDPAYSLCDVIPSVKQLGTAVKWLDADIAERLCVPTVIDLFGAVSLQLLRSVK